VRSEDLARATRDLLKAYGPEVWMLLYNKLEQDRLFTVVS